MAGSDAQKLALAVCESLGLPPNHVASITLQLEPFEAYALVKMRVPPEFADVLKRFDLNPKEATDE